MGPLQRLLSRHPRIVDGLLVGVLLLLSAPTIWHSGGPGALGVALALALLLPLVWRRQWPVAVFLVVSAAAFVSWLFDVRVFSEVALLVALYTVASRESRRTAVACAGVLELGVLLAVLRWAPTDGRVPGFVFLSGLVAAAYFLGDSIRTRRAYLAALEDRAARLERERDQQAELAAAAERARIAREMHDVVAHSLSVMIAQADGAAFVAESQPGRAVQAMETVAGTGREALAEMRRLLGVLRERDNGDGLAPQPGVDDLDRLIAQVRSVGLPVRLGVEGAPRPLPAGVGLSLYRLVQESLTNTLKHAGPGATAEVSLRYLPEAVEVEVRDTGRGAASLDDAPASGQGLVGMRERVSLYGGQVEAGPLPTGGWRVQARLSDHPATSVVSGLTSR